MRKNWKKLLSLVLALAMVLNMNVAAFADEVAPVADPAIEEEAPAADPAPAAEEPAAAVEEPAEAEAPAEAAEEPAAAEPEAAAPVEAETENEDAAEGNESAPNTVINSDTTVSGVTITFEKHGSVISDNKGNLTIKKNTIVGLAGTADADITVTVEDGAEVYVGAKLTFADNSNGTDRDPINTIDWTTLLEKVTFAGSGTLYFGKTNNEVSVNATNTVDVSNMNVDDDKGLVISANEYRFYTKNAGDGYDATSFTGLSGKFQMYDMAEKVFFPGTDIAKSVSAADYSMSVNSGVGIYKNGKFAPDSTAVSTASIGEGKDFNFGEIIFYHTSTGFYFTKVSAKNDTPDYSKVVGAPNDLMESSWRPDGIDLEEALAGALTYNGGVSIFDNNNSNVEFTIVPKGGAAPDQVKSVWIDYDFNWGDHKTFKTLADGKTISANTEYDLYARNVSQTDSDPTNNGGFYSDAVKIGSFTTKETPDQITIPSAKAIVYQGDAEGGKEEYILLKGFDVAIKDKDGKATKKLTVGTDAGTDLDGITVNNDRVGLAVKIDGSTVGELKNYFVLSANGLSADGVAKMDQATIKAKSKETFGGMTDLEGTVETDIKYLSANTYYVRSFFDAYDDTSYTGTGNNGVADVDLPYLDGVSSNVMTLTVEKAPLAVVPLLSADENGSVYDKYDTRLHGDDGWGWTYSDDPQLKAVSGDNLYIGMLGFDTGKDNIRVFHNEYNDYFDNKGMGQSAINNIVKASVVDFDKEALDIDDYAGYTVKKLSASGNDSKTYTFKISDNSLVWWNDKISDNFIVDYSRSYTITVEPSKGGGGGSSTSYNFVDLMGYAYYGTDFNGVANRIYQRYSASTNGTAGEPIIYNNSKNNYRIKWGTGNNVLGDGFYLDPELKTKISSNEAMAEVEPGSIVYVSVDSIDGVSANSTDKSQTQKYSNLVAKVTIEARPIDVYAHAYPGRGEAFDGKMDPAEIYGDVREGNGQVAGYSSKEASDYPVEKYVEYWDSHGHFYGYDDYYETSKRSSFMGADLVSVASVEAENAALVDTTDTTYTWYDRTGKPGISVRLRDNTTVNVANNTKKYVSDPFKLNLKLSKGKGDDLAADLKTRFFINTAVGYVDVLPSLTVAYMLQYEDLRNDNGKNADKLVEYDTFKTTKEQMKNAGAVLQTIAVKPVDNAKVAAWAPNGILNKDDGDRISTWTARNEAAVVLDNVLYDGTIDVPVKGKGSESIIINADITATVGSYIDITSIAPVRYDGLAHVADNFTAAWNDDYDNYNLATVKGKVNDLHIVVQDNSKGAAVDLVIGKDYTVKYKNNVNASVYFEDNEKTSLADKVKPLYKKKSQKPCVEITGAGRYKGKFKAKIYFDIYPSDINGSDDDYIISLQDYYDGGGLAEYPTVTNVKDAYFAKTDKAAQVNYKVQNVQFTSKAYLGEYPDGQAYYNLGPDYSNAKIKTLKKNKDYVEILERYDSKADKNRRDMGWNPVSTKQLIPGYTYRITVKGKNNFTGSAISNEFTVYDSKDYNDLSKLKITVPGNINWEKVMVDENNNINALVDLSKLGIKVESKKKSVWQKDKKAGIYSYASGWTYDIYKINSRTGQIEQQVIDAGEQYDGGGNACTDRFNDAGKYKVVIYPTGSSVTEFIETREKDGTQKKGTKSTTKYYAGKIEKNLTVKGITLKKSDFKLGWSSKKWNGKSDVQTLTFSPKNQKLVAGTPVFNKNKINSVYVDKYLKNNMDTWYPFWNAEEKRYEAFVRDLVLDNAGWTPDDAALYIMGLANPGFLSDVYYTDNGSYWTNAKQIDVYRYTFEASGGNKDVGTYTITVPCDGIFGTDDFVITYKRTGTATKILSIENAK